MIWRPKSAPQNSRRFILALVCLFTVTAAIIGGALVVSSSEIALAQFVGSVTDDGTYYRLKVKLTYKGGPQDFDIVVGCNVRQIFYKSGGSTYEAGLIPSVFGRRMSDGKGLVVRPPAACRGETTANHHVRPDLLPAVVVYDSADTLDFGTAYLSDDAYESPLSVLKFGGATIERATRAEFDAFRRTQENLVTRSIFWTGAAGADVLKRMNVQPAIKPFARLCEGYQRYDLSGEAQSLVRQYWPKGDPTYWASTYDAERALHSAIRKQYLWFFTEGAADFGMPRRGGAFFPASSDYRLDRWPPDEKDWPGHAASVEKVADMHIDFRAGQTKGFAYCSNRAFPDKDLNGALSAKRRFARFDESDVAAARAPRGPSFIPLWIMERDEYLFRYFYLSLGSVRGDV
jgi:hypothetical protein